MTPHRGQVELPAHAVAFWSVLLIHEAAEAPLPKVGGASGVYGGVDLGVGQVGQSLAIGCHHP